MTTAYGTIPTAPPDSSLDFISSAKDQARTALANRRPWKEMIHLRALTVPHGLPQITLRMRTNLAYFRTNYAIIILLILFLSLLWHPISLIIFLIMMAAWLFLYFLRDEPLIIFHRTVDDRIVLAVLSAITLLVLLLTHATLNIIIALVAGVALVAVHAAFRRLEDLFVDEEEGGSTAGVYSAVGGGKRPSDEPSTSSS